MLGLPSLTDRSGQKGSRPLSNRTVPTGPNADTYYQMLGVDFRASTADITKAYRSLMKECHPDRVPPSQREETELFCKNLNHAYAVLKDPVKRQQYDRTIKTQEVQDQIMNRYVGGLGGHDLHGQSLRREMTDFEKAEMRQTDRSAMISLLTSFILMTAFVIGLLLVFAILSTIAGLIL